MLFKKEEFLMSFLSKGLSRDTVKYTEIYIDQVYLWLMDRGIAHIKQVTGRTIEEYQQYLINDYRKKDGNKISYLTVLAKLSALKKYFNYLSRQKLIFLDPTIDIELPKLRDYIPKNILTQDEADRLMELPRDTTIGIRDRAILELLYSSGIRRAEVVNLELYDVDLKKQTIHIRHPKNRRDRIVPFGDRAKEAIEGYLSASRPILMQDVREKALFLSQHGSRIRRESLNYTIKAYSDRMRLNKKITPHCLRHSCATHLLQNGANLVIIQQILGHTRIKTTQIYTRIAPEDLKLAIRDHHPRGRKKTDKSLKEGINVV